MGVFRIDKISTKGRVKKTDEGYLRGDAVITRTGVFTYLNPDGSIASRELRHPDDILKADSLESLKMRPITNLHPSEKVDAKNAKRVQIGMTGETVKHDGKNITSSVLITDQNAINAIEAGRQELSAGYFCDVVKEVGVYNGEKYDSRQVNVKYNHVAICEKGRAGVEARLNFDSLDSVTDIDILETEFNEDGGPGSGPQGGSHPLSSHYSNKQAKNIMHPNDPEKLMTLQEAKKAFKAQGYSLKHLGTKGSGYNEEAHSFHVSKEGKTERLTFGSTNSGNVKFIVKHDSLNNEEVSMLKLKIDSCEYDVPQEVKSYVDKLTSENSTLKGKCDAFEGRDVQKEIFEGIKARRDLEALAQPVLKDVKLDSLSEEEIKKQVIAKVLPDMKLDNEKPEYVHGVFVGACHAAKASLKNDATAKQRQQSTSQRTDGKENTVSSSGARERMIARTQNFGKDAK